jgi:DNA-binding NtrC family response regulator
VSRILIVDDKELMRDSVGTMLSRKGHAVVTASCGEMALEKLASRSCDAVITDLQMPGMSGVELLAKIRDLDEQIPVILMTAYGSVETAVSAMKQGAWDYITKPFGGDELIVAVERALDHGRVLRENQVLRAAAKSPGGQGGQRHELIGNGELISMLKSRMGQIADSHGTVLVSGESGSGKEVAARWIHHHSPRSDQPFLAINCAAIATSLLESELFGHEKGAFTGADKMRRGRFELADGGTLLLDEISEIDPGIQAKLLRVLQERTFERVGSETSRETDVRIIATSNRDLEHEVSVGTFRQDLFFRLNVLPLEMPALREHVNDIPELAAHFLKMVAQREGRDIKTFDAEAIDRLMTYTWPGNVRELQNICERAAVLTVGQSIDATLIDPWLRSSSAIASTRGEECTVTDLVCDGARTLEDVERQTIVATLMENNGHRQRSAQALGIGVRTLGLKLKKWKEASLVSEGL